MDTLRGTGLSRYYFINDGNGQRRLDQAALPLRVGGKNQGGIVIPDVGDDDLLAFIAIADGHVYIQPARDGEELFHNNELLTDSAWLKSGDRVQLARMVLSWEVKGDKVLIEVLRQTEEHQPRPPQQAPPVTARPGQEELPVTSDELNQATSHKRRRWFLAFASILLLATLYLLASIPLVITIKPQPEEVSLSGFPAPLSLWGSQLVLPGVYKLKAHKPGYQSLHEDIDIRRGEQTELSFVLLELPGLLKVNSQAKVELRVFVDGTETGVNQQGMRELSRGLHQLRIETERYLPYEEKVEIEGYGRQQNLDVSLQPAWAAITILSQPAGAEIIIDGVALGLTPLQTDVLQGQHELQLKKQGFKPVGFTQDVVAGLDVILEDIQLQPVDGRLALSSVPAGASILLDDEFQGTTPLNLSLIANVEHKLKLSKAGFATKDLSITLKPQAERAIEIKLPAEYGTVFLSVRPADTRLVIDGKNSALSSGKLRLTTRPHRLTVSKTGYVSKTLNITPQQGVSQNLSVTLETTQQQAQQKIILATPASITTVAGQALKLIKPGSSLKMGASRREAGRRANESQRLVLLQRPFYFSSKEVSNAEYRRFKASHNSASLDGAALNGEKQPVVNISWDDAARYSNWLSKQQGLPAAYTEKAGKMFAISPMTTGFRLPTEAEWSWVARKQGNQTEQRYPWKGLFPPTLKGGNYADANIADTLADTIPAYDDGFRGSAPVASFAASPEGFYDLGGNAAEWMHDYYAVYPAAANKQVRDPSGPASGKHHVVRGSSWRHGSITELRLSYRDYSSKPRYDLGFRIARYAE
jgi:formylglycine-generating enzyme required for sulfatase activity